MFIKENLLFFFILATAYCNRDQFEKRDRFKILRELCGEGVRSIGFSVCLTLLKQQEQLRMMGKRGSGIEVHEPETTYNEADIHNAILSGDFSFMNFDRELEVLLNKLLKDDDYIKAIRNSREQDSDQDNFSRQSRSNNIFRQSRSGNMFRQSRSANENVFRQSRADNLFRQSRSLNGMMRLGRSPQENFFRQSRSTVDTGNLFRQMRSDNLENLFRQSRSVLPVAAESKNAEDFISYGNDTKE
ncbi:uncharacterized protein LOC111703514 isoform X2 [Eurytemora carolleeae]|uniref:uncharacterized protein LOC111703514 isoform X2 n=1 Tax=Eurytemora carolleeae TaxID=1294199 RepID=UPI000C789003|nr:uncharacterized protein LOC111703514 isoform X2 [Eurytemora carolleeae]|eukprot:XP_023331240.1 uncharacterized protein LOC111703514 isoform X2 [Eurytemora affinis]